MHPRTFRLGLILLYLLGIAYLALPLVLFLWSKDYTGVLPVRSPDEGHYIVRMQAHLLRPFAFHAPDGVWFVPASPLWLQVSLLEYVFGTLFSFSGWNALAVSWFLMIVMAPLAIPLTALVARRCGSSDRVALLTGVAFFCLTRYLARMFHPSLSFPLTAFGFLLLWLWWERPGRLRALAAGAMAGALMGVYLWSWTFLGATWAVLLILLFLLRQSPHFAARLRSFPFVALGGIATALPSLLQNIAVSHDSLFAEVSDRMGLLLSRTIESPARSLVLLLLTVLLGYAVRKREALERFAPLFSAQAALLLVYNQQLLHGRIISFSSHYYTYVVFIAILVLVFALSRRPFRAHVAALALVALVPLAAAAYDYRFWGGLIPDLRDEATHVGPAVALLNDGKHDTVLTDGFTGNVVGAATDDGVAFIEYARILLIPTAEYVERYCLSEALTTGPIDTRWLADFQEEQSRAGIEHTRALYEKHLSMTEESCPYVQTHLKEMLAKYRVTRVLWNERRRPSWKLDPALFTLDVQGDGWSLWSVR